MASERARRFAAGLVRTRKFRINHSNVAFIAYNAAFDLIGHVTPGEDPDTERTKIVDAIATALDRYEAEAWTAITDDPGSWPQTTDDVLAECTVNDVTRVRACWLAEGRWWTMTNRGVTQIATPTRYRLMPEVPR